MAPGANLVIPQRGVGAVCLKLMTERAIGTETGACIQSRVWIHVLRMGKLEDQRSLILEAREWHQLFGTCPRENRMALDADFFFQVLVKVILVTGCALIVPGPLQRYGAALRRHVASVTIE